MYMYVKGQGEMYIEKVTVKWTWKGEMYKLWEMYKVREMYMYA